jgi:hypothetical protein
MLIYLGRGSSSTASVSLCEKIGKQLHNVTHGYGSTNKAGKEPSEPLTQSYVHYSGQGLLIFCTAQSNFKIILNGRNINIVHKPFPKNTFSFNAILRPLSL